VTAVAFISMPPKSYVALAKMWYQAAAIAFSPVGWLHLPAINCRPATSHDRSFPTTERTNCLVSS
jgi:hypothetical protein